MKRYNNTKDIVGGTDITDSIINGIVNLFKAIYDIGRGAGSSVRRISTGNVCPL